MITYGMTCDKASNLFPQRAHSKPKRKLAKKINFIGVNAQNNANDILSSKPDTVTAANEGTQKRNNSWRPFGKQETFHRCTR